MEVTRLGCSVKKMTASLTETANVRDEAVERASNLIAQLAASVRREEAYKLELTSVKEDLAKTRVERTNLRWPFDDLVSKLREASIDLVAALQTVVKSSNRLSETVADRVKEEMGQALKQILLSVDMEYAGAVRRVPANVVRDIDELIWNVSCCTALVSSHLDQSNEALPVEDRSDTGNLGFFGPVELSGKITIDCDEPTVE